ncbi:Gp49 family protein [Endozoicomonas gorgoniicola]|uniref:Gp49 family protein n=1 Tax=Endozoicomonas gorgoniicola TaxID=1234144 RepID=A0ABT3MTA4_9GAMM|nr:Gp49 family protein [Endozoicomonas gorgoniicola]MCW7552578.1 Gp49 family protein [Endozoicomonas gorgoniicola]
MTKPVDFDHDHIKSLIRAEEYIFRGMTTICVMTLVTGHQLIGQGHCLNPDRYSEQMGEDAARADAVSQLYEKEAYRLQYESAWKQENEKAFEQAKGISSEQLESIKKELLNSADFKAAVIDIAVQAVAAQVATRSGPIGKALKK